MKHEIWVEGYLASGMEGVPKPAKLLARVEAETFREACNKLCTPISWQAHYGNYDPVNLTVWGCKLFNNEVEARLSYG